MRDFFSGKYLIFAIFCLMPVMASAQYYADLNSSSTTVAQIRTTADFDWKFNRVSVALGEELRFNLYPTPEVALAITDASMNVNIVKGYLSGHAGYMLRVRTNKFATEDVNKILRHRIYFGLNEHIKLGAEQRFTLSLRERAVLNMRTDSPNLFEKPANAWEMRYRLQLQYKAMSKPLSTYVWSEIKHTCNATEMQKYYNNGHNYISGVRAAIGLKWRLDATNTLHFYLRYDWQRDFDIDANKEGTIVKTAYKVEEHCMILGAAYEFGWKK